MKLFNPKTIAAALVLGAMSIGSASAMNSHSVPLTGIAGVSAAELNVQVEDGVATLFGNVDSRIEADLAKRYLAGLADINKVIDLVSVN